MQRHQRGDKFGFSGNMKKDNEAEGWWKEERGRRYNWRSSWETSQVEPCGPCKIVWILFLVQ